MVVTSLVALIPLKTGQEHNLTRITREFDINSERESRHLSFRLNDGVDTRAGAVAIQSFFAHLLNNMPRDNAGFFKRIMRLLQTGYQEIESVQLEMKQLTEQESIPLPDTSLFHANDEVSAPRVQEELEHAFPNGLNIAALAKRLSSSEETIEQYLLKLEAEGIVERMGEEWLRRDLRNVDGILATHRDHQTSGQANAPTIAIITHLFSEKQAIDAIIEEPQVIHRYKSGGDSNAFTIGRIGNHRVVAAKLAVIGDSREAATSAGGITTRLLGYFQHIEHVFVVGVGGAVPQFVDPKLHARLGDVIVSADRPTAAYVFAHETIIDPYTEEIVGFSTHKHNPVDASIANIVENGGEELHKNWERNTSEAVRKLKDQAQNETDFTKPPADTDVLMLHVGGGSVVVVPHSNQQRQSSLYHLGSIGGLTSKTSVKAGDVDESTSLLRDRFAAEFNVRALDAGVDSVVASIEGSRIDSWALIRGVADYQNGYSKTAKLWQPYAAARAAAMAQTIIERL
ncbi:unnamed protein product, partial [Mesorhabditis spiculigera]